jgi:hypothetical protein
MPSILDAGRFPSKSGGVSITKHLIRNGIRQMMDQTRKANSADVVIVGGGPAGLAAAIALGQKGIECIVVEALEPPIDKCCGEGLMPDALHSLKALGVKIREEEGYAFQGIRFADSTHRVDADFPNGAGIGVRRTTDRNSQTRTVVFQPETTSIRWTLSGPIHTVHGTFKLKGGTVDVNPDDGSADGLIEVDAISGESGNPARDGRMHKSVLESDRYPISVFIPPTSSAKSCPRAMRS